MHKWLLIQRAGLVLMAVAMMACASLPSPLDPPKVSVESFDSLPSTGGAPRFEIKLRIQNPNSMALDIAGVAYDIELLGREVMSGVTSDVPEIAGYSEEVVTLEASVKLFQLLRLLADFGTNPSEQLDYTFRAKVDFAGFLPTQYVEETGEIKLQ